MSLLYDHTPITLTARVIHGRRDGPRLFVSAAVHGDELNGVEIIRRLLNLPRLSRLRGTLVAVPVVNVYGFIGNTRYLPDRRDLNRSFPGTSGGSLASQLAHVFMREVVAKFLADGIKCPRKMLIRSDTCLLRQPRPDALLNVNRPEDLAGTGIEVAG